MNSAFDIFGRLKDHEIVPPAELTAHIRESVSMSSPFERLRDHSIPPPAKIFNSLERQFYIRPAGKRKTIFAASAAAAILCGIVLTTLVHTSPKPAAPLSKSTPNTQTPVADTVSKTTPAPDTLATQNTIIAKNQVNPTPSIDDHPLTLTDNDLLLTFTSYSIPQLEGLLRQEGEKDVSIRIDQYSNITLSRSMSSMLRDLYLTRNNGKPTRHARKTKEKLENWKNIDRKYFDNSTLISPIDPADLSSFIANPSSHPPATTTLKGQPSLPAIENQGKKQNDLTVSWQLAVHSKKDNSGIGETYNGGIKTLFVKGTHARVRLVSLMRIQSAFLTTDHGRLQNIVLAKESGTPLNTRLDAAQLTRYQQKYNGAGLRLTDDTLNVLQYTCKKAILSLEDGRELTAWYTPQLQSPEASLLEPVFSKIPGLVLQYEITYKRKTISYTATFISRRSIKDDVCMPNAGETK